MIVQTTTLLTRRSQSRRFSFMFMCYQSVKRRITWAYSVHQNHIQTNDAHNYYSSRKQQSINSTQQKTNRIELNEVKSSVESIHVKHWAYSQHHNHHHHQHLFYFRLTFFFAVITPPRRHSEHNGKAQEVIRKLGVLKRLYSQVTGQWNLHFLWRWTYRNANKKWNVQRKRVLK